MSAFHIFQIAQVVRNRATHHSKKIIAFCNLLFLLASSFQANIPFPYSRCHQKWKLSVGLECVNCILCMVIEVLNSRIQLLYVGSMWIQYIVSIIHSWYDKSLFFFFINCFSYYIQNIHKNKEKINMYQVCYLGLSRNVIISIKI